MESKTGLYTNIVMYVILAVTVILIALSATEESPMADGSWTGTIISWSKNLLIGSLVLIALSYVWSVVQDPSQLVKVLIGLVAGVALLGICWSMADDTPLKLIGYEGDQNQGNWLKIADVGVFLTYIGLGGALLAILFHEAVNVFK